MARIAATALGSMRDISVLLLRTKASVSVGPNVVLQRSFFNRKRRRKVEVSQ
jgi:hypothetical protein